MMLHLGALALMRAPAARRPAPAGDDEPALVRRPERPRAVPQPGLAHDRGRARRDRRLREPELRADLRV